MGYSKRDKADTHARIVSVAAKRFRELGLEGIGVADVMKEAGVTVGGFYKHFESRDELVVEALATAFQDLDFCEEHTDTLTKLLENYLSEEHRDAPGTGCALGSLLGDMSRASRSAKTVYATRYELDGPCPPNGTSDRRAHAILMISAMLETISLSRAVSDPMPAISCWKQIWGSSRSGGCAQKPLQAWSVQSKKVLTESAYILMEGDTAWISLKVGN
jgi:TetR/AcrR family transcriptional regulator, transcriptional repressor for nem operon